MVGAVWTLFAMIAGGVDTGWTFYTPIAPQASHYNVVPTMVGMVHRRAFRRCSRV